MNSYSKNAPANIGDLLNLSAPSVGPDFLVDTGAVQRRMDARGRIPFRRKNALFRIPYDASPRIKDGYAQAAVGKWVVMEERDGWSLYGDIRYSGPFPASTPDNVPMPEMEEWRMTSVFRYTGRTPKPVRIEFPKAGVKQSPDHRLTLSEAMKVWGIHMAELEK